MEKLITNISADSFYLYTIVVFLLLLFLSNKRAIIKRKRKRGSEGKHKKNVLKSAQIIKKIKTFDHPGQIFNYLKDINAYVFEELVLTSFKSCGYKIKRNTRYSGDGGIDGFVYKDRKAYLVQSKKYKDEIKTKHVNDLIELVSTKKAAGAFFVHTGQTPKTTYQKYKNKKVKIISGSKLIELIKGDYSQIL